MMPVACQGETHSDLAISLVAQDLPHSDLTIPPVTQKMIRFRPSLTFLLVS